MFDPQTMICTATAHFSNHDTGLTNVVRTIRKMSAAAPELRSYLPIEHSDLQRLAEIARKYREEYFKAHPEWAEAYRDRVLCIALCQGAAKHFIDGKTGINDFDVYTFYRQNPKKSWYAKRIKNFDFGDAKFGTSKNRPDFMRRRVDCLGRGISMNDGESATNALRRWLTEQPTDTAEFLAQKAVVLLEPNCGTVTWAV
jgi:hypothetical protein